VALPKLNMSILDALLRKKISPTQALALTETWAGQKLAQVPGGQFVEGLINDLAGAGSEAAQAPLVAVTKAIEAPVDTFLAAKLGPDGAQAAEDFNAAVDAQANALIGFIQLQASNLKQNLALGYSEG
jgi:hypothetical protein